MQPVKQTLTRNAVHEVVIYQQKAPKGRYLMVARPQRTVSLCPATCLFDLDAAEEVF